MSEMVERVARAIDAVQCWSRYNNWTSDRVDGLPIEVCRYGGDGEDDIVVLARFGDEMTEEDARYKVISEMRARAAIGAMKGPTDAMMAAGRPIDIRALRGVDSIYNAMVEEALK